MMARKEANNNIHNPLDDVLKEGQTSELQETVGQLTFGAAAGLVSGYTLKTAGKVVAITTGTGFVLLQSLAYLGYIDVDWKQVERSYTETFDLDKDGKITTNDAKLMWGKVQEVLTFNLPAGAGFTAGCFYGMGLSAASALQLGALYGIGGKFGGPIANALSNMATPAALEGLKDNVKGSVFDKISTRTITDRFESQDVLFQRQLQEYDFKRLRQEETILRRELRGAGLSAGERALVESKLQHVKRCKDMARAGKRCEIIRSA